MKAVFAATINNADPLAALEVGELPEPQPRPFLPLIDRGEAGPE